MRMRAALLTGPRASTVVWREIPATPRGCVRVRMEGCGLCASSLPAWEGRSWFDYPFAAGAPGHEGWGTIDEVGKDVSAGLVGRRVAAVSHNALAEYDVAPANAVVPIPLELQDRPFPGEALGCAMNVFRRSEIAANHTVLIVGIGFIGALLCSLVSGAGARVIAASRRAYALGIARRLGAADIVRLDGDWSIAAEQVMALTGGKGCERVIEAAGAQETLDLASVSVCERGRLIIAGYHQNGMRRVNMQQWNWRGIDVVNAHERELEVCASGIRTAVELIATSKLSPSDLYTHRFALDHVDEAFELMRTRPDGFMKALVII